MLVKGENCTLEDVHDAWAVNINKTWDVEQYGQHYSMVWFNKLPEETRNKDQKYVDAICQTARIIKEQ